MQNLNVRFFLDNPEQTLRLGWILANSLPLQPPYPAFMLDGELGAGKTTLVRGFVEALPGAKDAETASPSFNLVNHYPTRPPVAHFDLYRLGEGEGCAVLDADLEEELHDETTVRLVEWARYLRRDNWPERGVAVELSVAEGGREAMLASGNALSETVLNAIRTQRDAIETR